MNKQEKKKAASENGKLIPLRPRKKYYLFRSIRFSLILFIFGMMAGSALITAGISAIVYPMLQGTRFDPTGDEQTLYIVIALLFSLSLGVIFSVCFSKFWLNPAEKLHRAVNEVTEGNYNVSVSDRFHKGEYGDLIRAFNRMAEQLSGVELFRTDFINHFSHEFKTPIVSIMGFARRLRQDNLSEQQRQEYLTIIVEECERLTKLSSDILLLSKLDHEQILTSLSDFDIDEQLRRALVLAEPAWSKKNIALDIDLEPSPYTSNPDLTVHIWQNLLSNAVKFSHEGGTIHVRCYNTDDDVVVEIEDHGIGMNDDTLHHIYEKFYQGDPSHKSEGNGLGLALVYRIVEILNGKIEVESVQGSGSLFRVLLPQTHRILPLPEPSRQKKHRKTSKRQDAPAPSSTHNESETGTR